MVILVSRFFIAFPPILFVIAVNTGIVEVIFLSNILVGAIIGAGAIATTTLILDTAPEENRSTYQALFTFAQGFMAFLGSLLMGIILQLITGNNIPSIEIVCGLLLLVAVLRFSAWLGYQFLIEPDRPDSQKTV